jgi:hypothetical protein
LLAVLAVLLLATAVVSPAIAERPYYAEVEKIRLPNGDIGEAGILNCNGIFGPDHCPSPQSP